MTIQQLLEITITKKASDLHLLVGEGPVLRINGELSPVPGLEMVNAELFESLVISILTPHQKEVLFKNWELDFGLDYEQKARFRANIYKQKGNWAAAFRLIPNEIKTLDELGLPPNLKKIAELKQGLILVTGPTGHGKTTTLASFINLINQTRNAH